MTNSFFNKPIYYIAKNEFKRTLTHPLIIFISIILLIYALLNSAGGNEQLIDFDQFMGERGYDAFLNGLSALVLELETFFGLIGVFMGAMSIAQERAGNSLGVLITKSVYRRDIILGKIIGLNTFLLTMIAINVFIITFLLVIFFRMPLDLNEFICRCFFYILILFFTSSLYLSIGMIVGTVFKNILISALLSITILYLDSNFFVLSYLGGLIILSPYNFMGTLSLANLDTTLATSYWLREAGPYIFFVMLEIIVYVIINCLLFSRNEEN